MSAIEPPTESSLNTFTAPPRVVQLREDAVLFYFTSDNSSAPTLALQQRVWALAAWLEERRDEYALKEIVPGMGNLLLSMNTQDLASIVEQCLTTWPMLNTADTPGQVIEVPVVYGNAAGPDLMEVSVHTGLDRDEIIARHCAGEYRVYCLGFQPGFAYLGGLDPALATPRRATPRLAVPEGSVAIGGTQSAIYPSTTPGGWQIIGHTTMKMFDADRASPSLLKPGDRVRFVRTGGTS